MKFLTITEDEFDETYQPIDNKLNMSPSTTQLFETSGADLIFVQTILEHEPRRVWTYLEGDSGLHIGSGFHYVNCLGFYITKVRCPEDTFIEVLIEKIE